MQRILKVLPLVVLLLLLPLAGMAQISKDTTLDLGNNGGTTNSLSTNMTLGSNATLLAVCLMADNVNGGHDDITSVTYNSTAMTLVSKYTTPNGSHNNNRMMYLYKLANPSTGAAHAVAISSTNNHYLLAVAESYNGASDLGGPHQANFGPSGSSPYGTSMTTSNAGSWVMTCDGGIGTEAAYNTGMTYPSTLEVLGGAFKEPTIYDAGPVQQTSASVELSNTSQVGTVSDVHIMAEVIPATGPPQPWQASYTSSNSWVANATDSGMNSCDYQVSIWDTTTSPYTNLTSSATMSCDGSYNITAAFSANQTGTMVIIPNPNKCGSGTC